MFGYVTVLKDELKIKDYNTYRAYYCGLCHEIGKNHNQLSRLALNYDLTTLAILLDSLSDKPTEFYKGGCIKKLGKRPTKCSDANLKYAADMNVLLAYFKLLDDIRDNRSIKALLGIIPFALRSFRLKKKYPKLFETVKISLDRLAFLENDNCDIIDKVAHESATMTKAIFAEADPLLASFGYSVGRLVYILDAYDDMARDYKEKNYNPAVLQYSYKGVSCSRSLAARWPSAGPKISGETGSSRTQAMQLFQPKNRSNSGAGAGLGRLYSSAVMGMPVAVSAS